MTRILALGDTQLGVGTVTLESQAQVLDRIADAAIDRQADLVLHGGDVFEGPVVLPEQMRVFLDFARRLRDHEIPLLVLRGNGRHDMATRDVHALDVLREVDGITVSDRADTICMPGCNVSTLPWTKLAREDRDAEQLVEIARNMLDGIPHDLPHILALHWSISGASLPTGLPVDQLHEPVLEWGDLDGLGYDCVIASHIHKAQGLDRPELGDTTRGFYTGSPQPLNHGESGYEHGVWIVDAEPGSVALEFLPIESPQFKTIDWHQREDDDSWEFTLGAEQADGWAMYEPIGPGDIVRVRYTATREQDATIDKDAIRRELLAAGASRVTIEPQITREVRARVETMTQELGPLEALHIYADAQGIDEQTNGRMVERLREWIA